MVMQQEPKKLELPTINIILYYTILYYIIYSIYIYANDE